MLESRLPNLVGLQPDANLDRYQRFGIELEYEGNRNRVAVPIEWAAIPDGSLRNGGIEYVSQPLTLREVSPSLRKITAIAERNGCRATPRCGLHVHLNMRPYNAGQILSFATVYGLLEPTIFSTYAEGRASSPFCVPQYANTAVIEALRADANRLRMGMASIRSITATNKYSALNYASLARFGTLEARHLYCTLDPGLITAWVKFLKGIIDYSIAFDDPAYVLDEYERGGLGALQRELLGRTVRVCSLDQQDAEDSCMLLVGEAPSEEIAPEATTGRYNMDALEQFAEENDLHGYEEDELQLMAEEDGW